MKNSIYNNINKGVDLLNEAMNQYKNNNPAAAYKLYEAAGSYLKNAHNDYHTPYGQDTIKYGDNRNFGAIYKIFEANTPAMLQNPKQTKQIVKVMEMIKEDKVLANEFAIYNSITNPINVENSKDYVNESLNLTKNYDSKTIREHNQKFLETLRKYNFNENININDEEQELFESIEYVITNPKSFNNINEYNKIQNHFVDYINENNQHIDKNVNIETIYENKINELIDKHIDSLNEDEIKLIRDITTNPTKAKKLFNENKKEVINLIENEMKNNANVNEWQDILENIKKKEYSKENALSNIAEFLEIKNTF
jgi:hypothetical protein